MTPIAIKNLPADSTGCTRKVIVWGININAKSEEIQVIYDLAYIGKDGSIIHYIEENANYRRYNRPVEMNGEIEVTPANMKFDELRNSEIGQAITALIENDLLKYPDLTQN
jgi:hypothetical protein